MTIMFSGKPSKLRNSGRNPGESEGGCKSKKMSRMGRSLPKERCCMLGLLSRNSVRDLWDQSGSSHIAREPRSRDIRHGKVYWKMAPSGWLAAWITVPPNERWVTDEVSDKKRD